ncbi:galactose-binding domain-like protein [Aspergillus crustosus]
MAYSAQLEQGVISLRGDSNETTAVEVFTTKRVRTIEWNGKRLKTEKSSWGSLKARINGPTKFKVPRLRNWRVQDSLLERLPDYSDEGPAWVNADDNETPSNTYGFHTGIHLWRGYFDGSADGVYLQVQGGIAHGWSAWLNGRHIGSFLGHISSTIGAAELNFPENAVSDGKNVLLVMQDNSGHDQLSASLNVRGILNATFLNSESGVSSWKVAGTAGGSSGTQLDPVRTHYNEGGLRAERLGWHVPGYDDSDWPRGASSAGFEGARVKFYRTNLPLDTPKGHDVALSVRLNFDSEHTTKEFRAYVYINGYQYGRYYPYVNEVINSFPAPPGIWNYAGDNVIGLAIWNQGEDEVKLDVEVNVDYVLESSLDVKFDGTYLRPGWDERRALYDWVEIGPRPGCACGSIFSTKPRYTPGCDNRDGNM